MASDSTGGRQPQQLANYIVECNYCEFLNEITPEFATISGCLICGAALVEPIHKKRRGSSSPESKVKEERATSPASVVEERISSVVEEGRRLWHESLQEYEARKKQERDDHKLAKLLLKKFKKESREEAAKAATPVPTPPPLAAASVAVAAAAAVPCPDEMAMPQERKRKRSLDQEADHFAGFQLNEGPFQTVRRSNRLAPTNAAASTITHPTNIIRREDDRKMPARVKDPADEKIRNEGRDRSLVEKWQSDSLIKEIDTIYAASQADEIDRRGKAIVKDLGDVHFGASCPESPWSNSVVDLLTESDDEDRKMPAKSPETPAERKIQIAEEERKMMLSSAGRATLLAQKVQELVKNVVGAKAIGLEAVSQDEMFLQADRLMQYRAKFEFEKKPNKTVKVGYHYTKNKNMESIRAKGLAHAGEDVAREINMANRKSRFGQGIYMANNPFCFQKYGDVGLVCAILPGKMQVSPGSWTDPSFIEADTDTILGNKYPCQNPCFEEIVLRSSSQCVPLLKFSRATISPIQTESPANRLLWRVHEEVQKLIDKYVNYNKQTTTYPVRRLPPKGWVPLEHVPANPRKSLRPTAAVAASRIFRAPKVANLKPALENFEAEMVRLRQKLKRTTVTDSAATINPVAAAGAANDEPVTLAAASQRCQRQMKKLAEMEAAIERRVAALKRPPQLDCDLDAHLQRKRLRTPTEDAAAVFECCTPKRKQNRRIERKPPPPPSKKPRSTRKPKASTTS